MKRRLVNLVIQRVGRKLAASLVSAAACPRQLPWPFNFTAAGLDYLVEQRTNADTKKYHRRREVRGFHCTVRTTIDHDRYWGQVLIAAITERCVSSFYGAIDWLLVNDRLLNSWDEWTCKIFFFIEFILIWFKWSPCFLTLSLFVCFSIYLSILLSIYLSVTNNGDISIYQIMIINRIYVYDFRIKIVQSSCW